MSNETVFYMRGPLPLGLDFSISKRLVEDAKLLVAPSEAAFEKLVTELASRKAFLGRRSLVEMLGSYFSLPDEADRAAKFIQTIEERCRLYGMAVADLPQQITKWQTARDEEADSNEAIISDEELSVLANRLPRLFNSIPGLQRQAKARSLAERVGNPLEQLELICDARPVFDTNRNVIEGIVPLTTLRLVCKGVDGLPIAFDAVLTQSDLTTLSKASQDALKKLERISALMSEIGIATAEFDEDEKGSGNVFKV